jgi:hypothetical protein
VALLSTAVYGNSGAFNHFVAEEPTFGQSLGIGFDTFNNGLPLDPSDNHLSVHWNGGSSGVFNPTIDLNDNAWHAAALSVNLLSGLTELRIDGVLQLSTIVAGLTPYELRPQFGARTGGANDNHDIDEIVFTARTASSVPDAGTTAVLLACGTLGLAILRGARRTSPAN